jgi:tyramine---L-glutamate ligase
MRLLVFEFITGGGFIGAALPPTLLREGSMMRDALLADLVRIPGVELSLTRDLRCPWPSTDYKFNRIEPWPNESPIAFYRRALDHVDVVWPIAPESGNALEILAGVGREAEKKIWLSDIGALKMSASKFETARALQNAGLKIVPTFRSLDAAQMLTGQCVTKPDDGSGGGGIRLWPNRGAALRAMPAKHQGAWVVQPWCPGESLSLSLLCVNGNAQLISINRQHVSWNDEGVTLDGLTVNAHARDERFCALSQSIAQALPGLWGYVGVDLICADNGELTVLEINPRLTTSYCGLCDAIGVNVADLVLKMNESAVLPRFEPSSNQAIYLDLAPVHV